MIGSEIKSELKTWGRLGTRIARDTLALNFGPAATLSNSALHTPELLQDHFSPNLKNGAESVNWRQMSQVVFGNPKVDSPENRLHKLVRERGGEGSYFTKKELQSLAPNLFGDVSKTAKMTQLSTPSMFSDQSQWRLPPANALLYSNNPERLDGPNLKLAEGQLPAGVSRVMAHHLNQSNSPLQLHTVFQNNGSQPVTLEFLAKGHGLEPEANAVRAGLDAYYAGSSLQTKPESHIIKPGESFDWKPLILKQGDVGSSLALVKTSAPLQVLSAVTEPEKSLDPKALTKPSLESSSEPNGPKGLKHRGAGVYLVPDWEQLNALDMKPGKLQQTTLGPRRDEGSSRYMGDFGQARRLELKVPDSVKAGQKLIVLGWSGGKEPLVVRGAQNPDTTYEIGSGSKKGQEVVVLFEGEVKAGQSIQLEQMVQGGAATPLRILALPVGSDR